MSPKAFSTADRDAVWERLLDAAAAQFARYGYRKANISEIAKSTGIAKGTVYRFVPSKAELFILVIQRVETTMRTQLKEEMRQSFASPQDRLCHFLRLHYEALDQPLLTVMVDPDEAAALMRDLPPETMEALRLDDEAFYTEMAEDWRREGVAIIDAQVLAALPRALFAMALQREMIGHEIFPAIVDLMLESLSQTLTRNEKADV